MLIIRKLVLSVGPAFGINESFVSLEKKISINFSKVKTKFCLSLNYSSDNSYLFVNQKVSNKFKVSNKNINFPSQFYLGSIPNKFDYFDSEKVSLKGNVYEFSVDYNAKLF